MAEEEQPEVKQSGRKRRAVIIGIDEYNDSSIIPLRGAENDAREIYEMLSNPHIGGFNVAKDHFLIGADAKCERIRKAISDIFWKCDTDTWELALFYFSGHGFEDGYGNGYIAPYDMLKDEPFVYGINFQELKHVFSNPANKANIIILDSCYSGIATKGKDVISEEFFQELGEGRFILASSAGDQVSREIILPHEIEQEPHSHGTFTFYLIEGLNGKAAEVHGRVFLDQLYNYAESQLLAKGKGKQKPKLGLTDSTGFRNIEIAVIPDIYSKNIEAIIKAAEEFYDSFRQNQDISSLIEAVKNVHNILNINAKNTKAHDLKRIYNEDLCRYKDNALKWLSHNQDISSQISNVVFQKIENLDEYLDFDKVVKLDNEKTQLLILLCRVSSAIINKERFTSYCKQFSKPPGIPIRFPTKAGEARKPEAEITV
ncbi:MAG: caspase family protein [Candidatus Methanoperedens sp.]|nr:caspase family protein [Candidatus Methanoperedens sp.]MCZ7361337.1 caspase family protein [Candidatus Methanoperedens sp.]